MMIMSNRYLGLGVLNLGVATSSMVVPGVAVAQWLHYNVYLLIPLCWNCHIQQTLSFLPAVTPIPCRSELLQPVS